MNSHNAVLLVLAALTGCGSNGARERSGAITRFAFSADLNPGLSTDVEANVSGSSITATLPYGTNVTSLVPTIVHTGASVSPASGEARDFTNPVTYTVTAADSSTKAYVAAVNIAASSSNDILSFAIQGVDGVIAGASITIALPYGTNVTSLVPTIVHTGASVSPASGEARDFTNPVTYTVTAADSSTKAYSAAVCWAETVLSVTLPEGTPADEDIFLANNLSSWDPQSAPMARTGNQATIVLHLAPGQTLSYKYTRGAWSTVEKSSGCHELPNRELVAGQACYQSVSDTVAAWADQCL